MTFEFHDITIRCDRCATSAPAVQPDAVGCPPGRPTLWTEVQGCHLCPTCSDYYDEFFGKFIDRLI